MARYRVTDTRLVTVQKLPPTAGKTFFKVLGALFALWVVVMALAAMHSH